MSYRTFLIAAAAGWALLFFGLVGDVEAGVPNSMGFPVTDYQDQFALDNETYYYHWHLWTDGEGFIHGGH